MLITYENVTPTMIENTTMQRMLYDGVLRAYRITPNEGYVLHDADYDMWFDIEGNELTEPIPGYGRTTVTCPANYDFTANPREFYAVPEDSVPADQIFGGGDNDHEVM